jgi:hypothetical protein
MRSVTLCVLLMVVGGLTACSADADEDQAPAPATPAVDLSFNQLRNYEGTNRAQLRVVNGSDQDLQVTGVGLDWPGYGDFLQDYDTTVEAGRTLDLRVDLPEPDCTPTDDPVTGVLRVGDEVIRDPLDESGTGYVTRIWDARCRDLTVGQGVDVVYGDTWRLEGTGRESRLAGTISLVRAEASGPVVLTDVLGSVLLELHLPRPGVLPADADRATFPVTITVPRCDTHALVDSSQTFHFMVWIKFDGQPALGVIRPAGTELRTRSEALLNAACG